jgi:hypothetical protein
LLVESFTSGNPHKIKGVSTGETSKFECTATENTKVRTCKFREILLQIRIKMALHKDYKFIV